MADTPIPGWTDSHATARFSDPDTIRRRTTMFERTIRRRNAIEYGAGIIVIAAFGWTGFAALSEGRVFPALAVLAIIAGVLVTLWNLHRRAGLLPPAPEEDCRTHLLAQLQRQQNALASVPRWYLAPLVPGLVLFALATGASIAPALGWLAAAMLAFVSLGVAGAVFALIARLNRNAARRIAAQIAALEDGPLAR